MCGARAHESVSLLPTTTAFDPGRWLTPSRPRAPLRCQEVDGESCIEPSPAATLPRCMPAHGDLDRDRVARLHARRARPLPRGPSEHAPPPGTRARPHAERDPDVLDGFRQRAAGLRRPRRGRSVHGRRRLHLPRLQRLRHVHVLWPREPRHRQGGHRACRSIHPFPSAHRGLGLGRRGARAPVPRPASGSSPCRPRRRTPRRSGSPGP